MPPRVVITNFSLDPNNKNPLSPEEARLNPAYRERIELDYDQNLFNIEFTALDFADPGENQYAYRLKGFDETWSNSGTRHQVTYTNLDHGAYVFEVRGAKRMVCGARNLPASK